MSGIFPPLGEWSARSACRGVDPEIFFEKIYESDAKRVCRGCTVQEACLTYALQYNPSGVWAQTNPAERRRLRRRIIVNAPVQTSRRLDEAPPVRDARRICPSCRLLVVTIPGSRGMEECTVCEAKFFGG